MREVGIVKIFYCMHVPTYLHVSRADTEGKRLSPQTYQKGMGIDVKKIKVSPELLFSSEGKEI